jgi:hypothetical protein
MPAHLIAKPCTPRQRLYHLRVAFLSAVHVAEKAELAPAEQFEQIARL